MNTQKIKVKKMGMAEVGNHHPLRLSYLRNKPTNTNNATSPANPDSPNVFMIDVRLPITLTPKIPLPKIPSETAPMATKDINR